MMPSNPVSASLEPRTEGDWGYEPHVDAFIEELHQRHRAYEELLVQRAERAEQAATEARREHAMWVEATYGGDGRTAHVVDAEWYERAAAALEGVAEARRELLAKVEGLTEHPACLCGLEPSPTVSRADLRRLIEDRSDV